MMEALDKLLSTIQTIVDANAGSGRAKDAIDAELAAEPRTSKVVSVRDDPAVEAFRTAATDALIAHDALRQGLELVNTLLTKFVIPMI